MNTEINREELDDLLRAAFIEYEAGKYSEAIEMYVRAARYGSSDAMTFLGVIYDDKLVPPDERLAKLWFKRGVSAGDPLSAWNLAMHYAAKRNRRQYLFWLSVASNLGHECVAEEIEHGAWWQKLAKLRGHNAS
jgi:TPR repeat protein